MPYKIIFFLFVSFVSCTSCYANCSFDDERELKEILNLVSIPIKFLNINNECRFTVFQTINNSSLATDLIAIRDGDQRWVKGDGSSFMWFTRATKTSNYRFISRDGKSIEYYDLNFAEKKIETNYKMNKKDGLETTWFKNGNIKSESHYMNNLPDGAETVWSESGKKVSERYFKNGLPDNNPKPKASNHESNQELTQIEAAKQKCLKLGFKEKTEKFGVCVLELIN